MVILPFALPGMRRGLVGGLAMPFALTVSIVFATAARADSIYFCDLFNPDASFGFIRAVGLDGQNLDTVREIGGGLIALAVDSAGGKMYWVDYAAQAIRRANLNGTNVETIVTDNPPFDIEFPSAIAVDSAGGKIYWGDQTTFQLCRANLDGSSVQVLRSTAFHRGIALDVANGKVYWSTSDTFEKGEILRCNLDGTTLDTVVTSFDPQFKPNAIALDLAHGKIYWTDYVVDVVRWANLSNGSNIQTLFAVGANLNPRGIIVDVPAGKVYWGQDIDFKFPFGEIRVMNLDGSAPGLFLGGLGLVNSLAFAPGVTPCPSDVVLDGQIDVNDLLATIGAWGPCADPLDCPADIVPSVGDDQIDVNDLLGLIGNWGPCP